MQAANEQKVISVNVGVPREVEWEGRTVATSISKKPVNGSVIMRQLNLDGDEQADLSVHGGPDKAVYVYSAEYYPFWKQELTEPGLEWGMFGENLTIQGLLDEAVNIGDRFKIGTAEVVVTQPRTPCYKLNLKFGRSDMVRRFSKSGYSGFYLAVTKEGEVEAGDPVTQLEQDPHGVKVSDINRLYLHDRKDLATIRRALQVPALAQGWQDFFQNLLTQHSKS